MGAELQVRPPIAPDGPQGQVQVVNPQTGELLDLAAAPAEELASWIEAVRLWEANARAAKRLVNAELHSRMDDVASWTLRAGEYELCGESPDRWEYDGAKLADELRAMTAEGLIAPEAADAAIKVEVVRKPAAVGINALLKRGGEIAERVRACGHQRDPRDRRVSLKRRGAGGAS